MLDLEVAPIVLGQVLVSDVHARQKPVLARDVIFALTAGDAWDTYKVARGPDPADVYSRPLMPSHHLRAAPLRCGIPGRSQLEFCGDAEAAAMFERGVSLAQVNLWLPLSATIT